MFRVFALVGFACGVELPNAVYAVFWFLWLLDLVGG